MKMSPENNTIPAITGVGASFGKNIVNNADVARLLQRKEGSIKRMMESTGAGIQERRWVDSPNVTGKPQSLSDPENAKEKDPWKSRGLKVAASDLGAEALQNAAKMAGVDVKDIKTIIGASGSQDVRGVAVAAFIQERLGLGKDIRTYDVYSACPGWIHALNNSMVNLSSPYGEGGPQAAIGVEVLSPILSKKRPSIFVLFGDAAGATVTDLVVPDAGAPTTMAFKFGTDGSLALELCMPGGGSRYPTSEQTLEQDLETLVMNGPLISKHAVTYMAEVTRQAIKDAGVEREDIDWVIPHQANLGIMQSTYREVMGNVADESGIPYRKMISTVQKYGNTSAASIPTAMNDAIHDGRLKRNDLVVVTSFGAGLNYAAAVLPMVGLR